MELKIDVSALSAAAREAMEMPGLFKRAERSALKSTGYMVRTALRDYVESGGHGSWPELHPVSRFYAKKYKTGTSKWWKRNRSDGPMDWLGKFARYRVVDDEAVVGFGKSHSTNGSKADRKKPGTIDPFLMSVVRRSESGEKTAVTPAMRRFFGATRRNNSKRQGPGQTFFPLRRSTTTLITPKRPIFDPVRARIEGDITPYFEDKFWYAINRHRMGVKEKI